MGSVPERVKRRRTGPAECDDSSGDSSDGGGFISQLSDGSSCDFDSGSGDEQDPSDSEVQGSTGDDDTSGSHGDFRRAAPERRTSSVPTEPYKRRAPLLPGGELDLRGSDGLGRGAVNDQDFVLTGRVRDDLESEIAKTGENVTVGRFSATRLLLTFPQNPSPKEHVMALLRKKLPALKQACVSQERHKDGEPHLHAVVVLSASTTITRKGLESLSVPPQGTRPLGIHILRIGKSPTDLARSVRYVCKDGNFLSYPDRWVDQYLNVSWTKKSTVKNVMEVIAKKIMDGVPISVLNDEYPGIVMQHLKKLEEYAVRVQRWKPIETRAEFLSSCWNDDVISHTPAFEIIRDWFLDNLTSRIYPLSANGRHVARPIRTKSLMIIGPPGCGKSSFMAKFYEHLRIYPYPVGVSDWHDRWSDWYYDLCWFDEFHGGVHIWFLNQFLSGAPMPLNRRGTPEQVKMHNVPCVFAGNKKLTEIYRKAAEENDISLAALIDRFTVVTIDEGDNLMNIFK